MAITKKRKDDLVSQYAEWANESQAMIVTKYVGLNMKQIDDLRSRVREAGGEFHIVKNTLGRVAFKQAGIAMPEDLLEGDTAVAFAFKDAPAMAKVMSEFARTSEAVEIKGAILEKRAIAAADVKALADLPPLPVMRAQLLGTLLAPANQLVRTLAEPARAMAAVLQAYVDQQNGGTAAPAEA